MSLILEKVKQTTRENANNDINHLSRTDLVKIISREFKVYDFKLDTQNLLETLYNHKRNVQLLNQLSMLLKEKENMIPSFEIEVEFNQNNLHFNNKIYLNLLKQYYNGRHKIPFEPDFYSERNHAQNTYELLSAFSDIDTIKYEQTTHQKAISRNLMVKSILSHQNFCYCCGNPLDVENNSIDHLIALSDGNNHLIKRKEINNIFNLSKMCQNCNFEKQNKSLLDFHFEKGHFKFYPLNVLYILHLQREELKVKLENDTHYKSLVQMIKEYTNKFMKRYKTIESFERALNFIPYQIFEFYHTDRETFKKIVLSM